MINPQKANQNTQRKQVSTGSSPLASFIKQIPEKIQAANGMNFSILALMNIHRAIKRQTTTREVKMISAVVIRVYVIRIVGRNPISGRYVWRSLETNLVKVQDLLSLALSS
jgi:hypothetical protein